MMTIKQNRYDVATVTDKSIFYLRPTNILHLWAKGVKCSLAHIFIIHYLYGILYGMV